jgi:uncharacterized caspase-like protein
MAKLFGAQRMVLQALSDAQGDKGSFIEDSRVAQVTSISLRDMRDWFLTLDNDEYVDLARNENGMSASVTAKGRLALGLYQPFPTAAAPEPARSRSKTGRERALVIGISDYPSPIPKLLSVANDAQEVAKLLGSAKGLAPSQNVLSLTEADATSTKVLEAIEATFSKVEADDAVFAYLGGHGAVQNGKYYFIAHDTSADKVPSTGVALSKIKHAFDASPSQRAFLWLDFCHSGGIIPRGLAEGADDNEVVSRELKVAQGQGKLIIAACTPSQSAWGASSAAGHGWFTEALLKGLEGEAANKGEVTINSLYDYIDKRMGSDLQRPMMFGTMTGRVVLVGNQEY